MNQATTSEAIESHETKNQIIKEKEMLDFSIGFLMGIMVNLFSFYSLSFFINKRTKRKGMLYGCIFSFVLILFFASSFTAYSLYVQQTLKSNRKLKVTNQKVIRIDGFVSFIHSRILRLSPIKVE